MRNTVAASVLIAASLAAAVPVWADSAAVSSSNGRTSVTTDNG